MVEYDEATAIRRATRLVNDSGMDFSVLNILVYILLMALVVVGIASIFQ